MNSFTDELNRRLADLREQNLFRELRRIDSAQGPRIQISGQSFLNFSANDYLGLANHPALKEAAIKATETFGAGTGASRLVSGSLAPFHELEEALADFKQTEAALTFSSGYAAAMGTITALMGRDDVIILDKLVHACIVDAAKLSGSKLRIYEHNDLNDLEAKLQWAKSRIQNPESRVLIITESVFSMDGDIAPLREIVALKEKYHAWLMVDEAHATGIIGELGRGLAHQLGISSQIEIHMGTLGKALGSSGGYICSRLVLIDYLINRARSFIFSTAPTPAAAVAATAAIHIVQSAEGEKLRIQLQRNIASFQSANGRRPAAIQSAILPLILGEEKLALAAATALRTSHIFVPAIRYPTVARGAARLRITFTAAHSAADIAELTRALGELKVGLADLKSP